MPYTAACREQHPVRHPIHTDYLGVDILVFREEVGGGQEEDVVYGKNAVVMSNGELCWSKPETFTGMLDFSPCG